MHKSHAHSIEATEIGSKRLNLGEMFGFSSEQGIFTHEKSRIAGQLIEAIETGEFESYDLNPWQRSLARELMIMIADPNCDYDAVFKLIGKGLDIDPIGTLKALSTSLASLNAQGFGPQVAAFTSHLKLSGILGGASFDPFVAFANLFPVLSSEGHEASFSSYMPAELYNSELAVFVPASTLNAGIKNWWGENNIPTANDPQNHKDQTHIVSAVMAQQARNLNKPPAPAPIGFAA